MRADLYVANALNISRNKASELIKNQKVLIDERLVAKLSDEYDSGDVALLDEIFVGRAALKLRSFLSETKIDVAGLDALDVGCSTGGFMQILLKNGVNSVIGVDVGSNQLDDSLRNDNRVQIYENQDIRNFTCDKKFDLITCDVSFISVVGLLKILDNLASKNATIIILFKPQFEVGREVKRNKKGVVSDTKAISDATKLFLLECAKLGWILKQQAQSQIKGKEGNAEFFYAFNKA
ncbi:23S rRNA (cytidine-2'-O)-methyltransferase TlyA [Campylobacter majalis]|uniref:23S rRNA (cytidine-2'-O)-methyltransferase TlyA n=1 Tax=Campylobacter majalis TaxID=2790656 RepID=UPI003D696AF5